MKKNQRIEFVCNRTWIGRKIHITRVQYLNSNLEILVYIGNEYVTKT